MQQCRGPPLAALAGRLGVHHCLQLRDQRQPALLLHPGRPGHQRDLPDVRVHAALLVHDSPAARPHIQHRAGRVLGAGGALARHERRRPGVIDLGARGEPERRGALTGHAWGQPGGMCLLGAARYNERATMRMKRSAACMVV